ncbi:zinc-binding alcohol dehydrogenase family protein [Oscillospiraceae bacterium LTW-04]|nr:zinc-binding alcohol dehydrogenase family protein [Oscillospiraceae bacterium MB24-C1]
MKAVQFPKPWQAQLTTFDAPVCKDGEALIAVKSVGICGSDIGAYRGSNPLVSYPRIIGHEIAGEVISIPENSKGIRPGDHVIVDPYLYCGHCYPCSLGRTNCCTDLKVLGVHVEGGMAQLFAHPAEMLIKVPQDMPWEIVPIAEPLTIALHGLHRANLTSGEHIAIFGAGPIGLLAAMAAIHYGAIPILIDPVGDRLEKAKLLGIIHTVNPSSVNLIEEIAKITNGRLAEVVMEASGASAAIRDSLNVASNAGRIILTGWPKQDISLPTSLITRKELDIRGARTSAGEFEEAIDLIYRNKVDVRTILTKTVPIEQAVETIIDIEKNPGDYLKVNVMID